MQQIERYGVIALVFLLVTIVAVSFWGDSKSPGFWSRLTGKGKKDEVAKVEPPPAVLTSEQALATNAPLNAVPAPQSGAPLDPNAPQAPASQPVIDPALAAAQPPAGAPLNMPVNGAPLGTDPALALTTPPGAQPLTQPLVQPLTAPPAGEREYTVQKGDSLALIARRTLGSEQRWTEIQALNNGLQPKSLKVGMKLKLPADSTVAANVPSANEVAARDVSAKKSTTKPAANAKKEPAKAKPVAAKNTSSSRYTIQKGDTLYSIAEKKLGGKSRVKELLAANPGLDARHLVVGRTISLPARGESAKPSTTPLVAVASKPSGSARPQVR